ncbi:hypothetical protein [Sphingopyxis sp.]|uniref:hypothetical protein n=1 Tax=Sphingopyxis sp. TaxID=1908224 RepID=UPI003D6C7A32
MANETAKQANRWRVIRWATGAGLLLVPLVMMQIVDDWNWGPGAFLFMGVMIGGVLLLYEFAVKAGVSLSYRGGVAAALAAAFLMIWINLAVGIVGEDNPVNFNFFMVVFAATVGSYAARGQPAGMARAMLGVAAVQALLAIAIATAPSTALQPNGAVGVLVLCGFFTGLWLLSAALFWRASRSAA